VRLAEQWSDILASQSSAWRTAAVTLSLDDPAQADRAAVILGPAAPGRHDGRFRVDVSREARPVGTSAALFRRVLLRLDEEGVGGRLELVGGGTAEEAPEKASAGGLASQWSGLLEELPSDWSHLLAQVDFGSSDYLERAALLMAPMNPTLAGGSRSFRFRAARTVGYGVSPGMARRCLERVDRERITGHVSLVQVVSDARPVATQGPVWRIGGRSV
jgi:hypothetical protein